MLISLNTELTEITNIKCFVGPIFGDFPSQSHPLIASKRELHSTIPYLKGKVGVKILTVVMQPFAKYGLFKKIREKN